MRRGHEGLEAKNMREGVGKEWGLHGRRQTVKEA
jgi:hypothetical protein